MKFWFKIFKEIKENLKYIKEDVIYEEYEYLKNKLN